MSRYEELKKRNPHLKLFRVTEEEFRPYGRVIGDGNMAPLVETVLLEMERPAAGSSYVAAVPCLDENETAKRIRRNYGGQMDMQIGLCHGHNERMGALEWHKSSEFNVAVTDMVLFLGDLREMEEGGRYDSGKVEAFYLEEGQMVEVYGTTLHFCPCEVDGQGFSCIVILPRGTNTALEDGEWNAGGAEADFLWARNKWLICHEENAGLAAKGVWAGIYGENWKVHGLA